MASISSCKSASIEMDMSQRPRAVISPASNAFWWPRLRLSLTPSNSGFSLCRALISSQVRSRLPSSTRRTRLSGEIRPFRVSSAIFSTSLREVSGSTSSSL